MEAHLKKQIQILKVEIWVKQLLHVHIFLHQKKYIKKV